MVELSHKGVVTAKKTESAFDTQWRRQTVGVTTQMQFVWQKNKVKKQVCACENTENTDS